MKHLYWRSIKNQIRISTIKTHQWLIQSDVDYSKEEKSNQYLTHIFKIPIVFECIIACKHEKCTASIQSSNQWKSKVQINQLCYVFNENLTDPSSRSLLVPLWLPADNIVSWLLQSVISGLLPRLQQLLPLVHLLLLTLGQLFVVRLFSKQMSVIKLGRKVCAWNIWLSSQW